MLLNKLTLCLYFAHFWLENSNMTSLTDFEKLWWSRFRTFNFDLFKLIFIQSLFLGIHGRVIGFVGDGRKVGKIQGANCLCSLPVYLETAIDFVTKWWFGESWEDFGPKLPLGVPRVPKDFLSKIKRTIKHSKTYSTYSTLIHLNILELPQ